MVFCETYSNFINRPANVRTRPTMPIVMW